MRITKPLSLGLMHRTYTHRAIHRFVIKPLVFFDLIPPGSLVSEQAGWQRLAVGMPENQALDEAMPKASPEVVLVGRAHSQAPVKELEAALRVGGLEKRLRVNGDRIWQKRWYGYRATSPATFSSIPVSWDRAFGSKEIEENPLGQGALGEGPSGETIVGLPNIEYPGEHMTRVKQQIRPAGFGPIHPTWEQRKQYLGEFDQAYIDKTFPDMPDDLDFRRFNVAPQDQQISALKGDEAFRLDHLHAEFEALEGWLPGVKPRAFTEQEGEFKETELELETIWLLPEVNLGVLIFCGEQEVPGRHAPLIIDNLLLAYEHLQDAPRSVQYYEDALAARVNPETAPHHVFDDAQLSPAKTDEERLALGVEHQQEVDRRNTIQDARWQATKQRYEKETGAKVSDELAPKPVDPDTVIAPAALARGDFSASSMMMSADASIKEAEAISERERAEAASSASSVPPMTDAEIITLALRRTRAEYLADYESVASAGSGDDALDAEGINKLELKGLATAVQPQSLSLLKWVVAEKDLRGAVAQIMDRGESMAFRDFTGADLSGFDFSNVNLEGSLFECTNLKGTQFQSANIAGASFLAANIEAADFSNANLKGANLSRAYGKGTCFIGADLSDSVLMQGSNLIEADFYQAVLKGLVCLKSKLQACSFDQVSMLQAVFSDTSLIGSTFFETTISMSQFLACDLSLTEWHKVSLERSIIINSSMQFAGIYEGQFARCQIAGESWVTGSIFAESEFTDCGLRSLRGSAASFEGSRLIRCDLGMSSLFGASFKGSCLSECLANESDFRMSDFQEALISSTNLSGSLLDDCNLTGTDFFESDILLTRFENSNIDDAENVMPLKQERLDDERRRAA